MGHCRCTELQKERGILRFPDFSQPSPLCRFHITADSKPRRRRRRRAPLASTLQSFRQLDRVVPNPPNRKRGEEIRSEGNGAAEMTCVTLLFSRDHSPIKRAGRNLTGTWLAGSHDGQVMESSIIFPRQ
ncbi:hypothetical protein VZT92_023341 [Zoarces viviparus]|uniref:Uncharacterized protein n=1 Tax=Zoarces viviparus TaxID=48416 RepID=A0AAW1E770_ZOAVI